jgi:hypothetical protein
MSQRPISLSKDLQHLREDGYDIKVLAGYLLLKDVPYVNTRCQIARGTLVAKLDLAGDVTVPPGDHVAYFVGEQPCDSKGEPLTRIINASTRTTLAEGLTIDHTFSSKPSTPYKDYYEKMKTYVSIIANHAHAIDGNATAKTFPVIMPEEEDSVFKYEDTASSRAEIAAITQKLAVDSIAIVGLGGTGSYILDLIAKTPARAIHLYDGDRFSQHNAFRSPGAPSSEALRGVTNKAVYFQTLYSPMRNCIIPHPYYIDATNVGELRSAAFVFLCIDRSAARKLIIEHLDTFGTPFIDVGIGVPRTGNALGGIVRLTTSTPKQRTHVPHRVPLADTDEENEYNRNIQISDLNALNAALAVIKWKKLVGFYRDDRHEHHATYTVAANMLLSEDEA